VPYTGGLGIASGDDRQGTASQTMQDNKVLFSLHFRMPTFELHSPLTAHQTVKNCYRLFEELGTPFAVIMNYDLSYREVSVDLAMDVDLGANMRRKGFTRDPKHLVTIGPHIRPREHNFHSKLIPLFRKKIGEYFDFLGNKVQQYGEKPRTLLLLNGPFREDFQLVKHDRNLKNRLLKKFGGIVAVETTVVFPQPESLYKKLITKLSIEKICVFEEGYGRVIYMQLLDLVNRHGLDAKVFDCGIPYEPRIYERFSYIDHILAP
jgi:TPP-dependent indolepyruvate ferredoxin oxidoreductase alpha subunit